ncbi:serine hydrolase [Aeromicrobium phragmitis]|uniref:Serine hydrolase n=1 Tax=Aeromicrobium phragmitis TaxID=2478914 RepID=A0A3L8PKU2_9ACTN|nr:serine hydrolase [Aeromicrobium phragmitis]RLV55977.1 serine hydrolase [Aeromicrobium phragmitis]
MTGATAAATIDRAAADVGIQAWVHARRLGPDLDEVTRGGDELVPMASLYKLPLAACWSDLVADGALDATERLRVTATQRAPGPTGLAALLDDVEVSQRDAVRLMLSLSDNAAAEQVLDLVGLDRLSAWLTTHGLNRTIVRRGSRDSWSVVVEETGGGDVGEAPRRLANTDVDVQTSEYNALLASATTAADMVTVLGRLWEAEHHAMVRDSLRLQAWRHRIGSGFPHDDVGVYGKTGTLGRLRHEAAVIEFPHEHPVAVAVLTKSARPETHQPRVDAAIGAIARAAVTVLRRPL